MNSADLFKTTYTEEIYHISPPPTVIINKGWKELTEDEIALLSKILNSVRQSLASVKILEMPALDLSQMSEKPAELICFGSQVTGLQLYEVIETPETRLVVADNLSVLSKDDQLKKRLWTSLKQLFSL